MTSQKNIKNLIVQKESESWRLFKYKKGAIDISFNIRVDIKQHMKDLLNCLESATVEIKEELEKK